MHVYSKPARLLGGLSLLALCGCHTYSPYGYGSGSGYGYPPPGTYAAPPSRYVPGGTVVPGTVVPNRSGNPVTPGKTVPDGNGASGSNPGASAFDGKNPTIEAHRGSGGLLPNEKPVPDPKGADSSGFPNDPKGTSKAGPSGGAAGPMTGGAPSGAFSPGPASDNSGGSSDGFPAGKSPFSGGTAGSPSTDPAKIKLTGSDKAGKPQEPARFQQPRSAAPITPMGTPAKAGGGSSTIIDPGASTPMSSTTAAPSPYAFDESGYTWLRGKVDFDEGTRTWQIIYSLNGKDKYGGSLTLADDPKLKKLQNDDVILVEGTVDETRKTGRGKPVYKIDNLFGPLVPKAKIGSIAPGPPKSGRNAVVTSAR